MVTRVAVNNNFNCTKDEWKQLDQYVIDHPKEYCFINCNINTPKLQTILEHDYKAVITANPDLNITKPEKVLQIIKDLKSKLAFVRIKYLPKNKPILDLIKATMKLKVPVVITNQRFNCETSLLNYTKKEYYAHSFSRYRLAGAEKEWLFDYVAKQKAAGKAIGICDQAELGCQGCGMCATLTKGSMDDIAKLNLSSSGACKFNCPDCYAQEARKRTKGRIAFDKASQNAKQKGTTKHILHAKAA